MRGSQDARLASPEGAMSRSCARPRARSTPASARKPELEGPHAEEVDGILNGRFWVRWQVYLEEWNCWMQYSDVQSSSMERAWQREAVEIEICAHHPERQTWTINFISLTQTNNRSGTTRKIQRALVTHR